VGESEESFGIRPRRRWIKFLSVSLPTFSEMEEERIQLRREREREKRETERREREYAGFNGWPNLSE